MAVTFLFTAGAAMALLPAGLLLYFVLDPYAEPKVPKTLFDERKVFLTVPVGIVAGVVLALVTLAYFTALGPGGSLAVASVYLLLFIFVAALMRRVLIRFKTFGGVGGADPLVPVHTFAFGAVSGATIGLGLSVVQFAAYPSPPAVEYVFLLGYSADLVLLEAWAGLRFGRAVRRGFSWLPPTPVVVGELLGLLALSPAFAGYPWEGGACLAVLFAAGVYVIAQEAPRALKVLRTTAGLEGAGEGKRFGRGGVAESRTSPSAPRSARAKRAQEMSSAPKPPAGPGEDEPLSEESGSPSP